jgi:hypothetical protein
LRVTALTLAALLLPLASHADDFQALARQMRERALQRLSGPGPLMAPVKITSPARPLFGGMVSRYPWHANITTTVFWCGESAASGGGISNARSAFDAFWLAHFGGVDSPAERVGFFPARFIPRQNPFYVALPVSDVVNGHTVPEAERFIPWCRSAFVQDGQSVLQGRWIAIRHNGRTCYAQWKDVGPFRTDHWQYVFGNERPSPNRNGNAGLDVSPAANPIVAPGDDL